MDLPICIGNYSSNCDVTDVEFLNCVKRFVNEHIQHYREFFFFLCHYCQLPAIPQQHLSRCGGCQLVSYCSRHCQKKDRSSHNYLCKEFPIVKGANSMHATGHRKDHIASLRNREALLPKAEDATMSIFRNPRVCHTCWEAHQDLLTDCNCLCVSYCSKKCAKADKVHKKEDCSSFPYIVQSYLGGYQQNLPSLRDLSVCDKFTLASDWNEIIPRKYSIILDISISLKYDNREDIEEEISLRMYLTFARLSCPMSLLYALQTLPQRRLGSDNHPLEDLTTLNIHVVTSSPLFNSEPWEFFMHRLPKLKQLNVVCVMQDKAFTPSFNLNTELSLLRCEDCKTKNRIITYSVQQMQYHMYFSSQEYTEPDVVVIFGTTYEMSASVDDYVHSEISYRNMTYSRDTVLILTDATEELVKQGACAVNSAQPVDQLVLPQINPLRGSSLNRAELGAETCIINEKYYFTCLRRK
ncbi:unnamed protein product [Meganyctiphanes norvegica]|uniref:MYND-type domain-containing protein n=1 Tax=Meganyctiphanes norvegica TaxID=48144 RepID=A0AAV2QU67_MEGNR